MSILFFWLLHGYSKYKQLLIQNEALSKHESDALMKVLWFFLFISLNNEMIGKSDQTSTIIPFYIKGITKLQSQWNTNQRKNIPMFCCLIVSCWYPIKYSAGCKCVSNLLFFCWLGPHSQLYNPSKPLMGATTFALHPFCNKSEQGTLSSDQYL
jgi:hypothetical protein